MQLAKNIFNRLPFLIVAFCALAVLAMRLLQCQLADDGDNLSLFNPVYTLANYGKMVYPIHGYFDSMVVHPPLHYIIITLFYKILGNIVWARVCTYLLAFSVALFTAYKVKLPLHWKFAFLAALFVVTLTGEFYFGTRPSFCLAVYWFTAWLLIEAARQNNWKTAYLISGSLLIGLASVMHYFAVFTGIGLLVYAWLLFRDYDTGFFLKKSTYLFLPASAVVAVYLLGNIIPHFADVRHAVSGAPHGAGIIDNIKRHVFYAGFLPPFALALLVMLPFKKTRWLALAALPTSLFVFLMVYQKYDYFFTEQLLMFFGIFITAGALAGRAFMWVFAWFAFTHMLDFYEANKTMLQPTTLRYPGMEVARACAQAVYGNDARIASRMDIWYISGATHWLNVLPDLYWKDTVPDALLNEYLNRFEIIAEHMPMSNFTSNTKHETIPVWYMEGKLKLQSFFLHSAHVSTNSLNSLFFSTRNKAMPITGFAHADNGSLLQYHQSDTGTFLFVTFKAPKEQAITFMNTLHQTNVGALALPNPQAGHVKQYDTDVTHMLTFGVVEEKLWTDWASHALEIEIIDSIRITPETVNIDKLMQQFRQHDKPIRFYKTFEDWKEGKSYYD